jgi:hypothetical protein
VPPTPVRLTHRALEGGRGGGTLECLFRDYAGLRHDVRTAGAVSPVAVSPVWPSPPLPHHAERCDDIPMLLECTGTRRRHDCHCATYGPPVDGTLRGGGRTTNHFAATLETALVRAQDAPRRLDWKRDSPGRPSALWHCSPHLHT